MPIWLFVGAKDGGAKGCDESAETMRALGAPIKYTVYPDAPAPYQPTDSSPERGPQAGHDSWSAAYADPAMYEWLLSHTLVGPEAGEAGSGAGGILGWVRGLFAKL
jgi:predicted peptidase